MKKTMNPSALRTQSYCKNALLRLYDGHNYDELSIKVICAEAGVTRQAFYKNFKDKEDLVYAILDDEMEYFIDTLKKEPVTHLRVLCTAIFRYWSQNPLLLKLCLTPSFAEHMLDKFSSFFYSVLAYLPESQVRASDKKYQPFICRLLVSSFGEAMRIWQTDQYRHMTPEEAADLTASILTGQLPITSQPFKEDDFWDTDPLVEDTFDFDF